MGCEIKAEASSSTGFERDNTLRQFNSQVLGIPTPVGIVPVAYPVMYHYDEGCGGATRVMVQYGVPRRSFNEVLPEFKHTIKGKKSFTYKFNGLETYFNADKDETSYKRKKGFAIFELPYSRTFYNGALFYRSKYAIKGCTDHRCEHNYPIDTDHDQSTQLPKSVTVSPKQRVNYKLSKCNCGAK